MADFLPVKKLRKEPFLPSCNISCAQHCAMDVALEELFELGDVNAFVIGVGECVYYSRKLPFAAPKRNWAFSLTDNEIVFGDVSKIENALREIGSNGLTTVVIATCIPSIMNLDLDSVVAASKNAVLLKAPDFSGVSSYDIVCELYKVLASGVKGGAEHRVERWQGEIGSVENFRKKLGADFHIVNDRRYLSALAGLKNRFGVTVMDNTALNRLEFYSQNGELLGIDAKAVAKAQSILDKLRKKSERINVKCLRGADVALFFRNENFTVGNVIIGNYNEYTYDVCAKLDADTLVSLNYRDTLPESGLALDLSAYDVEIASRVGFDRLLFILEKAEELCL